MSIRAVSSLCCMPTSGMKAWLASALSIATTPVARYQNVSQPNNQPIFGLASRDAHWYDGPAERDAGRELRDHQRHQRLPDRRDDPQPDSDRSSSQKYVVVGREDADGHRDERERDREYLKRAESSFQFRFVATFHTLVVCSGGGRHLLYRHIRPSVAGCAPNTRPFSP